MGSIVGRMVGGVDPEQNPDGGAYAEGEQQRPERHDGPHVSTREHDGPGADRHVAAAHEASRGEHAMTASRQARGYVIELGCGRARVPGTRRQRKAERSAAAEEASHGEG